MDGVRERALVTDEEPLRAGAMRGGAHALEHFERDCDFFFEFATTDEAASFAAFDTRYDHMLHVRPRAEPTR